MTKMEVTKQEQKLITAMRNVSSQLNQYEVFVITRKYPLGYQISEYSDTFSTNDSLENIEIEVSPMMLIFEFYKMRRVHDSRIYAKVYEGLRNKITNESYQIIENGDN